MNGKARKGVGEGDGARTTYWTDLEWTLECWNLGLELSWEREGECKFVCNNYTSIHLSIVKVSVVASCVKRE